MSEAARVRAVVDSEPDFESPQPANAIARFTAWLFPGAGLQGHGFKPAEVTELLDGVYARGDRIMGRVLYAHAAIATGLAFFYGTWLVTLVCMACAVGMFVVSRRIAPQSFITRCVAGVALQTFVALHIYQLHGLAEMHFFFFTAFTAMIVYQDWISMWPGTLLIISQHILFAVLHNSGVNLYFFENRFISFTRLFFHFGIAIVHVALCGYWAYLNREHTLASAWQRRGLERQRLKIATALERSQRSEQAERATSNLLSTLVDNVPGGILVEDETRRLRHVNRGFCELSGVKDSPVALVDSDCGELFERLANRTTDGPDFRRATADAMRAGGPAAGAEVSLADGRTLEWEHVPLMLDGVTRGHLWHFRDITERKLAETEQERLEGELRHSQKMQAIGTLAGGVAHDFNNVLSAIMGYTELARKCVEPASRVSNHLNEVLGASRRAADLVRQILSFSRRQEGPRGPIELEGLVHGAVRLLRASLPTNIEIVTRAPDGPLWVRADACQLEQVLINLGSNAAHAQPAGGRIEIQLRREDLVAAGLPGIDSQRPARGVCLTVRDHGTGMDADTRQRVFEPFFTTKAAGQGTGLGLAVVHGIVRDHAGVITVESEPGRGTCFSILLPLVEAPTTPAPATTAGSGGDALRGGRERVMIVDDEKGVANTRGILLGELGYEVVVHLEPLAALEDFKQRPGWFDLVLTDHMMPGMDGLQLADALLEIRPDVAILLTSGNVLAFSDDAIQMRKLRGLLPKPSSLETMAHAVRKALAVPAAG